MQSGTSAPPPIAVANPSSPPGTIAYPRGAAVRPLRASLTLCALALVAHPACRRRHRAARPAASRIAWSAQPPDGLAIRVDAERLLRGAVRVEGDRVAAPPWPASPLVAVARAADNLWLFAAEDGTLYRAPTFTGPLAVTGAIEGRAAALVGEGVAFLQPRSNGTLFVVDTQRGAWASDATSAPRRLPLERVVSGAFVTPSEALAVVEPGALRVSRDGGAHFEPVALPTGVALSVDVDGDDVFVRTTDAILRWRDGALSPVADARTPRERNALDPRTTAALAHVNEGAPAIPLRATQLVANPNGTVSVARGSDVVTVDPRTGAERSRVAAPGEDCTLVRVAEGLRAVCRHGGWAVAAFALRDGATAWTTLRDELRAEPMGRFAFDARSRRWVLAAPCVQRTVGDPRTVCAYDDAGVTTEHRAPFAAYPVAMRDGVALILDAEATSGDSTEAVLLRDGAFVRLDLPLNPGSARTATFDGRAIVAWDVDRTTDRLRALVRGEPQGAGYTWRRLGIPAGSVRGVFTAEGTAFVVGPDASLLAVSERGRPFRPLPSPVVGDARGHALALDTDVFCAGPWCRFGANLTLSTATRSAPPLLVRAEVTPAAPPRGARPWIRCTPGGANTDGPELDHGAAYTGYAIRATTAGDAINLRWEGSTLDAAAMVRWPGAGPVHAIGAAHATRPAAVLERCSPAGCDYAFAMPGVLTPLALHRPYPNTVTLIALDDGWVVRADEVRDAVGVVTLLDLSPQGSLRTSRTYALAEDPTRAAVGAMGGRVGLWMRTPVDTMRFIPLDARPDEAVTTVRESHAPCAPDAPHEGYARVAYDVSLARGEGWFVEGGEWAVESVFHVANGETCVAAFGGGEPREEPENEEAERGRTRVRSVVLRAAAGGRFEGRAWAGRLILPQRCTLDEGPRMR
jgi:hypothetical protein